MAPRHLRIYANHSTIVDFAEAEPIRPHLNISLLEGETGVVEYPMRAATFASVHSLSLFFVCAFAFQPLFMLSISSKERFCGRRDLSDILPRFQGRYALR